MRNSDWEIIAPKAIEDIATVIDECKEVQHSNESQFTKEQEMVAAYWRIKDIVDDYREKRKKEE